MRKLLLGVGTIAAISIPVATAVACGESKIKTFATSFRSAMSDLRNQSISEFGNEINMSVKCTTTLDESDLNNRFWSIKLLEVKIDKEELKDCIYAFAQEVNNDNNVPTMGTAISYKTARDIESRTTYQIKRAIENYIHSSINKNAPAKIMNFTDQLRKAIPDYNDLFSV